MRSKIPLLLAVLALVLPVGSFSLQTIPSYRRPLVIRSNSYRPHLSTKTSVHAHNTQLPSTIFRFSNQTSTPPWLLDRDVYHDGPPQMHQKQQQQPLLATTAAAIATDTTTPSSIDANKTNGRWLLLLAAALYGTNFACVKLFLGGNDAISMGMSSTLRFGLAALATSPWLFQSTTTMESANDDDEDDSVPSFLAGFEVGVWTSIGYIAQAVGLETTLASESAFLCSLAVVIVPLLDWMTGKALRSREVVGAVLALVGVAMLELSDSVGTGTGFALSQGDLISMIQPFAFGVGFWRMEAAMRKYPNQANRSTAAQLLAVFLASGAYTLATEGGSIDMLAGGLGDTLHDPYLWAGLLWTGCVTTALSVYMETVALQTLSAAETTLILSTEPLWGSITAAVLLGESFGPVAMAGGALVIVACVWSNLGAEGIQSFLATAGKKTADGAASSSTATTTTAAQSNAKLLP